MSLYSENVRMSDVVKIKLTFLENLFAICF